MKSGKRTWEQIEKGPALQWQFQFMASERPTRSNPTLGEWAECTDGPKTTKEKHHRTPEMKLKSGARGATKKKKWFKGPL